MKGSIALVAALMGLAMPASAQSGVGGTGSARVSCPGCDSAQMAAAQRRSVDTQISALTIEIARNQILYENLKSRLAPDSPEPPRSQRERVELDARLAAQSQEMASLIRQLSARCGEQEPIRGYLGVTINNPLMTEETGSRVVTTHGYPVVLGVQPESPAARAGIATSDTIIAINREDVRGRSFDTFVREPGKRLTITVARQGGRRNINVLVASRPPTFGGACLQYREFRFTNGTGQNVVTYRNPGAASGGVIAGTRAGASAGGGPGRSTTVVRSRVVPPGQGQQPVNVELHTDTSRTSSFIMLAPSANAFFVARGGSGAIVAGAEISLVHGALKGIFAVEHGALVLAVAPRSPAEQAGIVAGDVIVRANGDAVTAIPVIQQAIHGAGDRKSVSLDIIRDKKAKVIVLRW